MDKVNLISNCKSNILFSNTFSRTIKQVSDFILIYDKQKKYFNNGQFELKETKLIDLNNNFLIKEKYFPFNEFIISEQILLNVDFNVQILFKFESVNNENIPYKIGILINIYDNTCEDSCFIILEKYSELKDINKENNLIENYIKNFNGKQFIEYIDEGLNNNFNEILVLCSILINKSLKIVYNYAVNLNLIFSKFENYECYTIEMKGSLGEKNLIFYVYNKSKNLFTQYNLKNINYNKKLSLYTIEYLKFCNGLPALNEGIIFKFISIAKNLTWICVKNIINCPIKKESIKLLKQYTNNYIKKLGL
jgi:hypothetical protein